MLTRVFMYSTDVCIRSSLIDKSIEIVTVKQQGLKGVKSPPLSH